MVRPAVLLSSLLPLLAFAQAQDPYLSLAQERVQELRAQLHSPRGAPALVRLHAVRDELEDLSLLAKGYGDVIGRSKNALNRDLARQLLMELELSRGRLKRAAALRDELGFLHDFYVVGGFENEGRAGCERDFGPEATVNGPYSGKAPASPPGSPSGLGATYTGVGRVVGWRKLTASPVDGRVDLTGAIQPSRETVAYALTFLDSPQGGPVTLGLGASGGHRLWINGVLVSSADGEHPAKPDQARVQVTLRPGVNPVLLKVCHDEGALAFYLREESAGRRARGTLVDALPQPTRGVAPAPKALPTLVTALEAEVKAHPTQADVASDLAVMLGYLRPFDARDRLAVVAAERAVSLDPKSIERLLLASQLEEDDANIRRAHLQSALALAPESPRVLLGMAHYELSRGHPERARPLLESALKLSPLFATAALELARVEEELGDWASAASRFEDLYRRFPHLPRVTREAARVSRRMDRLAEASDRYRVALALRFEDNESRQLLAGALGDLGRIEEALAELQRLAELNPYDPEFFLKVGELAAANGMTEVSMSSFEKARAIAPDQPEVHEREGRALLQAGERDKAIVAFERALTLRPQNPGLREVLRTLKNERTSYGSDFLLNPLDLLKEAEAYKTEDAVVLVDMTHVRVQASGLSSRLHQLAVKVLTDRGVEAYRSFPIPYAPSRQEVRVLKARVVKADGSVVDSYGEGERAMNEPWAGMYYDARAKVLSFPALAKGDMLELQFRLEDTAQENLLSDYFGDVEYVQGTFPKIRYGFFVDMPPRRPLFWNRATLPSTVTEKEQSLPEDRVLYRFEAKGMPRVVPEPNMPGWAEVVTTLHVSTYKTWDEVGRYYWGLVKGQLVRNDELHRTVEATLKNVDRKDTRAVVRALYDFVVSQTRYVALEFGIHGFQPYRVDRILARRFGDCKDKASLLNVFLADAGVDSRLVLLRMRHLGHLAAEPASLAAFNHAIVYVPSLDLYLDGTAEFHGASELPGADHLANVLVVDPAGSSAFVTTPDARAEDNVTSLALKVTLKPDGTAQVSGESQIIGLASPDYRRSYRTQATRKATFEQGWAQAFPGLRIDELSFSDLSRLEEPVSFRFNMFIPRYAEVVPLGLRFYPFGTGRAYTQSFAPLVERKFDLVIEHPWTNRVAVEYALPADFSAAATPTDLSEETPFGRFHIRFTKTGTTLKCEGEVVFKVSQVKASDYAAFRAFLGRVDQAFARRWVLNKGGTLTGAAP